MIQPRIILNHGPISENGSRLDSTIERSGLSVVFKEIFSTLNPPTGIAGTVTLHQRHDNPDALDLHFYSTTDFGSYRCGYTYTSADRIGFERADFEQFGDVEGDCRRRLDRFATQLTQGQLQPGVN